MGIYRKDENMYQFTEDCLTGVEIIDEEHRQLFSMINEAFELLSVESASVAIVKNLISELKKYAATHFAHEEAYMAKINDPELPRQKKEHAQFTEKVNGFDLEHLEEKDGKKVLEELLEYLSRWLYSHILGSDIMIGKITPIEDREDPFAFTEKYKTGIELIDDEHRRLFEIIKETNELTNDILFNDKYDDIKNILSELKDYTLLHFRDEEAHMERVKYQGLEAQRCAHQAFVDRLNEVNLEQVDGDQEGYLRVLIAFLLDWLVNHILKMDKLIPQDTKNK